MFVHIHIPIIDCRSLCSSFQRLKRPVFPIPEENDFIRNFGKVSLNYIPALPCYAGEDWFFRGENTVRFKELPDLGLGLANNITTAKANSDASSATGKWLIVMKWA